MMSDRIVLPECGVDAVSSGLRAITAELQRITGEGPLGLLGGENGYGVEFENDVFMMHPFCWCERPDCAWCLECECGDDACEYMVGGEVVDAESYYDAYDTGVERSFRVIPERECGNCVKRRTVGFAPNFLFKPTGAKVVWYKYIGRGMEICGELPINFHVRCVESLAW